MSSQEEISSQKKIVDLFKECRIPDDEILSNLGLFLTSKNLSRILFMEHIYKKIVDFQGVVMEMGTRFGQNFSLFSTLRNIYEPYNRHRKIISFDTFEGFLNISNHDGQSELMKKGNLNVVDNYFNYLNDLMKVKEANEPLAHIKKYEIIKGDAIVELKNYLEKNPQTIISLAYFDFDLYEPTKICLQMMKPYLCKGSIIAFDELNDDDSPGETVALKEVFDLNSIKIKKLPYVSRCSYIEIE